MSWKNYIPENYIPETLKGLATSAQNLPDDVVFTAKHPRTALKQAVPSWKLFLQSLAGMDTPTYNGSVLNQIPYTLGAAMEWVPIVGEAGGQQLKRYGDALNAMDAYLDNHPEIAAEYERRARERIAEMNTNYALGLGAFGLGHLFKTGLGNLFFRNTPKGHTKSSFTPQPEPAGGGDPKVGYNYKMENTEPWGKRPSGNFGITGPNGQKLTAEEQRTVLQNFRDKFPSATESDITAVRQWTPQPDIETRVIEVSPNDMARELSPFLVADGEDLHNMMAYVNGDRTPASPFPLTLERVEAPLEGEIVSGGIPFGKSAKPVAMPVETAYPEIKMVIGNDGKPTMMITKEGSYAPSELLEAEKNYQALLEQEPELLQLPYKAGPRQRASKTGYDPNLPQSEAIIVPSEGFEDFNKGMQSSLSFPDEVLAAAEKMDKLGFIDQLSPEELQKMVALQTKRMNDYYKAGDYDKYKRAKAYRDVMLLKREERRIKRMDDKDRAKYVLNNQAEYEILQQRLKELREAQNGSAADVQHRYNENMTAYKNQHHLDEWNKEMSRRDESGIPYKSEPDFVPDELTDADRAGNASIHEGSPTGQRKTYNPNKPEDNVVSEGSNIVLFDPNQKQFQKNFKAGVKGEQTRVKNEARDARAAQKEALHQKHRQERLEDLQAALELRNQYKQLGQLQKAEQEAAANTGVPFKATWNRTHAAQVTGQRPELKGRVWGIGNKYFPESHKRKGIEDAQASQTIDMNSAPWTVLNEKTKQILGMGQYGDNGDFVTRVLAPELFAIPTYPVTTTARSVGKSLYENLYDEDMVEDINGNLEKDKTTPQGKFDGTQVRQPKTVKPPKETKTKVPFKPAEPQQPTKSRSQMLKEKGLL